MWVGQRQRPRDPGSTSLTRPLSFTDAVCSRREKRERKPVLFFLLIPAQLNYETLY